MSEDIVERLRRWVDREIAESDPAGAITAAADEIDRLRLTDEEREAIKSGIAACEDITYGSATDQEAADTLKALLARTK
jgi:hypothetical protein